MGIRDFCKDDIVSNSARVVLKSLNYNPYVRGVYESWKASGREMNKDFYIVLSRFLVEENDRLMKILIDFEMNKTSFPQVNIPIK